MINISAETIIAQKVAKELAAKEAEEKREQFKDKVEFDASHYLNDRLEKGQDTKKMKIRLLPFAPEAGEMSPFFKVHVHVTKINENGEKKWKRYMCPVGMGKSDKCPFCEGAAEAHKKKYSCDDEALRKQYGDIEFSNKSKDYWLVRCIDRAHEEDGVKFWRFPDNKKGKGIYDEAYALFQTRNEGGTNIFDLMQGKDLIVTMTRQKESGKETTAYHISDDENRTPLASTEEQMNAWIYDKLTWEDVYPVKDYDYLFIAAQGESPIYSKELGRWSSKAEIDKVNAEINAKEFAAKVTPQPQDFSQYVVNTGAAQAFNSQNVAVNNSANPTSMFEQTTVKVPISELPTMGMQTPTYNSASSYNNSSDDDLPF
jgi:hypothetical protein